MKARRFQLQLWRIEDELRFWLTPPPAAWWAVMIPVAVAIVTLLVTALWRQGEIR